VGSTFRLVLPLHPETPVERKPEQEGPRVLVVDDEEAGRAAVRRALGGMPVRLMEAGTATAALKLARTERPDVVVLDLGLPDFGGEEVLEALRSDPATREVPILVFVQAAAWPIATAPGRRRDLPQEPDTGSRGAGILWKGRRRNDERRPTGCSWSTAARRTLRRVADARRGGYEVREAGTGQEALRLAAGRVGPRRPSSRRRRAEVCWRLRSDPRDLPILQMSASYVKGIDRARLGRGRDA
jgi:CheY-like chemotaxis protein